MYHMESIDIHENSPLFSYMDYASLCANNMFNVANFHIRNLMTGLKKKPELRTKNELDVIAAFTDSLPDINKKLQEKYDLKVRNILLNKKLSDAQKRAKVKAVKLSQFEMSTAERWFAGYGILDAVFRHTGNVDFLAHHSHLEQQAIRDCCEAWSSYFKLLKLHSCGNLPNGGVPKIPGYRKSGGRSTAVFDNIACGSKKGVLSFPYVKIPGSGKKQRVSMEVAKLPHASVDKLVEVRVVPYFGHYQVQIVTDDGIDLADILPKEENIIREDGTPAGVMTLDPGLSNLAAIADNKGNTPIVIKGGAVKARNQWYNKNLAFLKSEQMKGHDPKTYHPPATKRMKALSRKRDAFLDDTFYKYAHYIFRLMKTRGLEYLIIGHNKGQKQESNLGHVNNQAFVSVPFKRFTDILKTVARQYGVLVIEQEESYTSQASFAARDPIPTYGEEGTDKPEFSGKRTKRGLYRQNDGKIMNADINGSVNTGRKYDERIFPEGMDISYLYETVQPMSYRDILEESHRYHAKQALQQKAS